jgi:fructose-bisphosphate aldolase class I
MTQDLAATAKALVVPGKGILAADESDGTIKKRFRLDRRRVDRGCAPFLPRDALHDRRRGRLHQRRDPLRRDDQAVVFGRQAVPEAPRGARDHPGIKVDIGAKPLALSPGETVTEGLDGLRDRLNEYRGLGARFAKWRAVITIGEDIPSDYCIWTNAHALARYAALCQEAGLVPIVEPEVLMDGDHTIDRCYRATSRTLQAVFTELYDQRVDFEGMLLKPNMVLSGKDRGVDEPDVVANATLKCFHRVVPAAVPGIVFLSGGQGDEQATANLNAMNARGPHPWELSFSYGRALQAPALKGVGRRLVGGSRRPGGLSPPREDERAGAVGLVLARAREGAGRGLGT